MKKSLLLTSCALFACPGVAFAQSTGSVDFEKDTIIVTGTRSQDVGGVQAPDTPKAKAVITQEMIARSGPGQTVLDTINVVPGVSFQNNDAYGNSGGTLTVRGFDSTRVSYTLDGVQLNDSGNYNIYSNFSIDPELIEQVNVSLGSTDVDSPTASAVGGTINQRTRTPSKKMGGLINMSLGEFDYRRVFGMFDFGEIGPWGTRAFVAASTSKYDHPFNSYGKFDRQQYNAKVWQPVGTNGDFIALAGRYNQDRNNSFPGLPLRLDDGRTVGSDSSQRFPKNRDERDYDLVNFPCQTTPGVFETVAQISASGYVDPDPAGNCGTEFDRRYNPSNSISIRGNSRFTLTDNLVLTIDPSFQYTKANGGGTVDAREFGFDINSAPLSSSGSANRGNCATLTAPNADIICRAGYFGGKPYFNGVDLNGDGDTLDIVNVLAPSQTRTRRYAMIAGLRYDINDQHSVRVTYTHDRSNHRQTGEVGFLKQNGEPVDVFPVNDPLEGANGVDLQKRDRQSYAILNQVAGEYRGEFGALTVNVGARLPFFKRDLENFCFTSSASGFVECSGQNPALNEELEDLNPMFSPPDHRVLKYSKLLPNVGVIYDFNPRISAFASYSKGISVPSTDNLYNAFFFPEDTEEAKPDPETTDTVDGGLRYRSRFIQAQVAGWFTKFDNRLASAFDPELNQTVYRNLGRVNKWGIDGSIAYEPIKALTLYAFGSWNKSKIKDNVQIGSFGGITNCDDVTDPTTTNALRSCAFTKGNRESGAPKYTYGFSGVGRIGELFEIGATAKKTGSRFIFDTNLPVFAGDINGTNETQVFGAKAPSYWLVNLDARFNLKMLRGLEKSYFQLNVYNLFDKLYVGGFGGGLNQAFSSRRVGSTTIQTYGNPPFAPIGVPRTISGTLSLSF